MHTAVDRIDAIARFMRGVNDDLPHPEHIEAGNYHAEIRFGSLDDLRQWAAYLEAKIVAEPGRTLIGQEHITYHEATTSLIDHDPVRLFFMEYAAAEQVSA